ncbi:hypothetical protein [Streptomyces smyrnaeus]|uniref:aggregation-promoting factor C-terminal-like domain-containing protein n=1 Tax=Streptomyces smyrnaeus TaxID=1387713 RepID=UPI0033CB5813
MSSGVLVGRGYVSIRPEFEGDWSRDASARAGAAGRSGGSAFARGFGGAMSRGMGAALRGISGLTKVALASHLSTATAAAAAAAPALATVGTAAAALKVGLSGVGDAFKAAFDDKTIQSDAKAAAQATRQVESAQRGLANAQRALADARVQAAERIRDAQQQVQDAERDLADAQREARSVQAQLNDARREASRALQDMNQRLAESRLDEKEAVLRLKEAQEELRAAQQEPGTDPDDLARLNIAYERAKLNLTEQRRETKRLATDTAAANKAGIDGSEQVVAAKQRISEANRTVADRERALAQAQAGVDKARADGQRQIADAQRGVADAAAALAEAQANAASQTSALSDAMSKLAPNARSFVNAVKALSPAWDGLRLSVQDALFAGLDKRITTLGRTTIPTLKTGLTGAATQLNLMAKSAFDAVTELQKTGMLSQILAGANRNLALLRDMPGQMITAFGQLSVAAQPAFERLLGQFAGFADRMSEALTRSFKSGGLEQAIGVAFDILSQVGTILADAFGVVTNVLKTAAGAGGQVLGVLGEVIAELRRITAMPEVQAALQSVFSAVAQVASAAAPVIGALVRAVAPLLAEVAPVVGRLAAQLGPVLSRLASELGAALLPIARALMPAIEMIGNALIEVVSALTPLLRPIGELISAIIRAALPVLRPLLDLGVRLIRVLIAPLTSMVRALVPWVGMLGRLFGQVFGALKPLLGPLVSIVATLARVFAKMFVLLVRQAMVALRPLMPVIVQLVGLIVRLGLQIISALMPHWRQLVRAGMQLFVALLPLLPMLVRLAVLFLRVGIRVLGVVLPPLLRLATFLVGGFARAFAATIRWVARVVTWLRKYLGPAFRWLRDSVVKPVVNGIKTAVRWLWENILRPVFNAIKSALRAVGRVFRWLRDSVVKPVMNGIKTAIKVAWEKGIRPAFNAVKSAVRAVATAFEKAKDALGKSWAKIKSLTRKPIKWVIDIVYNKGVRGLWNTAAKVLPIKKLPVFKFASGGAVHGPGTATSDSIPARLSRGEHVWTAKEVQGAGGHGAVESLRAQARGGYAKGGPVVAKGGVPGFALGGAVDWFKDAGSTLAGGARSVVGSVSKGLSKLKDAALGGVYKAASAAAKPIRSLINKVPGGTKGWGSLAKALPTGILNEALSAIKGSENSTMGGEGVARALKWARSQAGKPYQWGGAGNPSWDCSGFMSGISKVIQGKNPKGRLWSTHAFSGRRAPAGWEYHKKSPFMIGITNAGKGHTAGTLAGVNVESRGGDGVVVGSRARGYRARMFGSRWYGFKPAIGGGGGGGAKATARQMLGEFGFSQKQWPALEKLWQRESGWRWNARNPSSGAYGIPQCVDLNTQILTRRGWLTHDQVRVGDETIGYNQSTGRSEWTRVTDVHHGVGELRRFGTSLWSAVSTPNHRWLVERTVPLCDLPPEPGSIPYGQCQCGCGGTTSLARNPVPEKGIKRGEPNLYLHGHHARGKRRNPDSTHEYFVEQQALQRRQQIVLARPASTASTLDITIQEAALLAWIAGDGWQQKPRPVRGKNVEKGYKSGSTPMTYLIGQTKEENWEAIDAAVGDHGRVTRTRERHIKGQLRRDREWRLSAPYARDLTERAGNPKTDCVQQVLGMSTAQREAWLEAIIAAEGHVSPLRGNTKPVTQITQKAGPLAEAVVLAVYLSGRRPSVYVSKRTGGRHGTVPVWTITLTSPRTGEPRVSVNGKECWKDESIGVQDVWCVTTDLGSWTARQGDDVFLTGNSLPASKMRSAGADWRTNPATQIKWGLRYIKSRYGSPSRAWAAWNRRSPHWYDAGGWLQPGATMAMNGTGRPEAILTAQQWRTMQNAVAGNGAGLGDLQVQVFVGDREITDIARAEVRRSNGELLTALGARAGR